MIVYLATKDDVTTPVCLAYIANDQIRESIARRAEESIRARTEIWRRNTDNRPPRFYPVAFRIERIA